MQAFYNWAIAISDRAKIRGRTAEAEDLWKQVGSATPVVRSSMGLGRKACAGKPSEECAEAHQMCQQLLKRVLPCPLLTVVLLFQDCGFQQSETFFQPVATAAILR